MRNNKLYSIQFLRFIAIILVIYSHSYDRLQRYLHMSDDSIYAHMAFLGRSGVDLFFVISGFIMAYITTESVKKDNFNFNRFMKKDV
ncbi:TPA: acyltransferase [Escherichia coli]|nr:acyltransferase [Escherichia coli]